MSAYDRAEVDQAVTREIWMEAEPEQVLLERWPNMPPYDVREWGQRARQLAADEATALGEHDEEPGPDPDPAWPGSPAQRAREMLVFAGALEDIGLAELAHRSRDLARDVLRLADELAAERTARRVVQASRDELLETVATGTYYGCIAEAAHEAQAAVLAKKEIDRLIAQNPQQPIEWPGEATT